MRSRLVMIIPLMLCATAAAYWFGHRPRTVESYITASLHDTGGSEIEPPAGPATPLGALPGHFDRMLVALDAASRVAVDGTVQPMSATDSTHDLDNLFRLKNADRRHTWVVADRRSTWHDVGALFARLRDAESPSADLIVRAPRDRDGIPASRFGTFRIQFERFDDWDPSRLGATDLVVHVGPRESDTRWRRGDRALAPEVGAAEGGQVDLRKLAERLALERRLRPRLRIRLFIEELTSLERALAAIAIAGGSGAAPVDVRVYLARVPYAVRLGRNQAQGASVCVRAGLSAPIHCADLPPADGAAATG